MNDNVFFCLSGLRRLSVYRLLVYQRRPECRVQHSEIGRNIQKLLAQIHITVYSMGMMTLFMPIFMLLNYCLIIFSWQHVSLGGRCANDHSAQFRVSRGWPHIPGACCWLYAIIKLSNCSLYKVSSNNLFFKQ